MSEGLEASLVELRETRESIADHLQRMKELVPEVENQDREMGEALIKLSESWIATADALLDLEEPL